MIVTLTANPSIDRTVQLSGRLERGAVLRSESVSDQAGGKGVNISRAAVAAGVPTLAVLPVADRDPFLHDLGIPCCPVGPAGPTRINLTITEPDGTTTKINAPGSPALPALLTSVQAALVAAATDAHWVVLAGSLPPGAPAGWYADLVAALDAAGSPARIAVDTSDEPLLALVGRLGDHPGVLLKPNAEELASLTGADPAVLEADPQATAATAGQLIARGAGAVLATLGAHGAVLVTAEGAWHASPPPITVVSTVGAGDSSLFGYLSGDLQGLGPEASLALAVAYGSAAAALPGTTIPHPHQADPDLVSVRRIHLTQGG